MPTRSLPWLALAVTVLAAAVRYPHLHDSLWLDEMTTLAEFVRRPWSAVLAAGPGGYVPNNHVLHTVLCKLIYPPGDGAPREAMLRLPAYVAGCLLPVALAWPLRRRPLVAGAVAVIAAVHPWLVALSDDARGYSLLLLLGVVATNLLPTVRRRGVGYAVTLAAAIYTVPLAILLVPAHAVAARRHLRRWAVPATVAVLLAAAGYAPMARGIIAYYRHPYPATMTIPGFLDALPRHALVGERLPLRVSDPLRPPGQQRPPDPPGAAVFWAVPVLAIIVGTAVAYPRYPDVRPLLTTLAIATLLGVALPVVVPAAAEVRFDTWIALWFCLAAVLLLAAAADTCTLFGRMIAIAGVVTIAAQMLRWDATALPNQPVREAVQFAQAHAPPGRAIVVLYIGATETDACYAGDAPRMVPAPTGRLFADVLAATPGRPPWVIVPFEQLAHDREPTAIWQSLIRHYHRVARLPGRLCPVGIYAPNPPPVTHEAGLTRADGFSR